MDLKTASLTIDEPPEQFLIDFGKNIFLPYANFFSRFGMDLDTIKFEFSVADNLSLQVSSNSVANWTR